MTYDVRLDFVVTCDGCTGVSPLAVDLDVLVERKLGLSHGRILSEKY